MTDDEVLFGAAELAALSVEVEETVDEAVDEVLPGVEELVVLLAEDEVGCARSSEPEEVLTVVETAEFALVPAEDDCGCTWLFEPEDGLLSDDDD